MRKKKIGRYLQAKTLLGNKKKLFILFLRALCVFAVRLKEIFVKL